MGLYTSDFCEQHIRRVRFPSNANSSVQAVQRPHKQYFSDWCVRMTICSLCQFTIHFDLGSKLSAVNRLHVVLHLLRIVKISFYAL